MKQLEAGLREVCGTWSEGGECWNVRSVWKCMKMYEDAGIKLLRSGLNISAQIMSAKLE